MFPILSVNILNILRYCILLLIVLRYYAVSIPPPPTLKALLIVKTCRVRHLVVLGEVRVEARDCIVSVNVLTKINVQ